MYTLNKKLIEFEEMRHTQKCIRRHCF